MSSPQRRAAGRKTGKGRRAAAIAPPVAAVGLAEIEACYDHAPIGMCVVDRRFRYLRINELLAEINGPAVAEHLGRTIREVIPKIAPVIERMLRRVVRTGRPILNFEVTGETPAQPGVIRTWLASWHPLKNDAGRMVALSCMALEITEQKRAEAERDRLLATLDGERRRLATVIEQMPSGLVIVEAKTGRVLLRNGAASRILGVEVAGTLPKERNRKWKILRPDGSRMPEREYPMGRAIRSGTVTTSADIIVERANGARIAITVNAAPIRDARGRIVAGAGTFRDVTVERAALQALQESEAKFRRIAEHSPFGLGSYDTQNRVLFTNSRLVELVGWSHRELPLVENWFAAFYPDPKYRREVERQWGGDIARVRRGELPQSPVREYRVACRDGSVKIMEITFALEGEMTHAVFIDITERKRAEEALREATEFMRALLEFAPMPIYVRDDQHRYRLVNRAWERVFRQKRTEVIGRAITDVLPRPLAEYLEQANRQVLATKRVVSAEETIEFPDGPHIFHTIKFPLRNAARRVDAVGGISIDMTYRIRAVQEIVRLKDQLEVRVAERTAELAAANRELREEIAERQRLQSEVIEVSEREQRRLGEDLHDELGQRLTGLGMMVAVLERELRKEGHRGAESAARVGTMLQEAVAAARDLARGFYPVVLEQGGLLLALRDLAQRTEATTGVRCRVSQRGALRCAEAAAIQLYRIAQEAVANAVKHAAPGVIQIELNVQRGRLSLCIRNDGRPFQPPGPEKRGLGLHIVRHRAGLIGAEITVRPGPRGGCEVRCVLPGRGK